MNYNYIKDQWNARTDIPNNWDNISVEEQIEFAYNLGANIENHLPDEEVEGILDDNLFNIIPPESAIVNETYWAKWDDDGWSDNHKLLKIYEAEYPFKVEYILNGEKEINNCAKIGQKKSLSHQSGIRQRKCKRSLTK